MTNTKYKKHVFVCENQRNSAIKKSCGKIGVPLRIKLKQAIAEQKLNLYRNIIGFENRVF